MRRHYHSASCCREIGGDDQGVRLVKHGFSLSSKPQPSECSFIVSSNASGSFLRFAKRAAVPSRYLSMPAFRDHLKLMVALHSLNIPVVGLPDQQCCRSISRIPFKPRRLNRPPKTASTRKRMLFPALPYRNGWPHSRLRKNTSYDNRSLLQTCSSLLPTFFILRREGTGTRKRSLSIIGQFPVGAGACLPGLFRGPWSALACCLLPFRNVEHRTTNLPYHPHGL